jgi:predicted Zn-dependent protease
MLSYCFCVIFILVWIYNIKDAYYLSLFSSFRDWFEVERVLLPMMENTMGRSLIEAPEGQIENKQQVHQESVASSSDKEENLEEGVIEVKAAISEQEIKDAEKAENKKETGEEKETYHEQEIDELLKKQTSIANAGRGSWRIYLGIALILMLAGLWVFKKDKKQDLQINTNSKNTTLFALTAPINENEQTVNTENDEEKIKTIVDNSPVEEVVPKANPMKQEKKARVKSRYVPFIKGVELASKGDFAKAAAEFENDMRQHEPGKEVWQIILNSFYRGKDKLAYEMKLRKYLEAFPQDASGWFNLGKILYDRKEFAQASQALVKGLARNPENVRGNFLLGSIYSDLELYEDAVKYLQKAVSYEPLNITFVFALAESLKKTGELKEARRFYKRVISLDAGHAQAIEALKIIENKLPAIQPDAEEKSANNEVVVIQGNSGYKVVAKSDDHEDSEPLSPRAVPDESFTKESSANEKETNELIAQNADAKPQADKKADPQVQSKVLFVKKDDRPFEDSDENILDQDASPPKLKQKVENNTEPKEDTRVAINGNSQKTESIAPRDENKNEAEKQALESVADSGISSLEISKKQAKQDSKLMNSVAVENKNAQTAIEELRKSAFKQYSLGKWESSLALYLEYLQKKKDPVAYDVVSIIFEKLGMHKDAFDAALQAYNLGLRQINNKIRLGKLAEKSGKYSEGCKFLKAVLKEKPFRIDLRIKYARCLSKTGNNQEAIGQLQKITSEKSATYSVLARVKREISKIRKAND